MRFVSAMLLGLGLAGCAAPLPSHQFQTGELDRVITDLTREEEIHPQDAAVKRDLGIALEQAGYPERALAKLKTAKELSPKDPLILYFYARSADQTDAYPEALANYSAFIEQTGRRDGAVLARIRELSRAQARRELSRAVRQEAFVDAQALEPTTVAVPRYANLAQDRDLDPLSRGLAVMLLTDLSRVDALRVVEREKLNVLQDEMKLSENPVKPTVQDLAPVGTTVGMKQRLRILTSTNEFPYYSGVIDDTRDEAFSEAVVDFQSDHGLAADGVPGPQTQQAIQQAFENASQTEEQTSFIDDASVLRMGKLLAAGTIVLGSFAPIGESEVELHADIADARGTLVPTSTFQELLPNVLRIQKLMTLEVLRIMGVELTDVVRKAIEPLPTSNFSAFLAFSRGLDWEARGIPDRALEAYKRAVELDPDFTLAQDALKIASIGPETTREYSLQLLNRSLSPQGDALEQLYRTGGWIGMGPGVVLDREDDEDAGETSTEKVEPARIRVEGELPSGGGQP